MYQATEGQAASLPPSTEPTIFARSLEWRLAFEEWLEHIRHPNVGAERGTLLLKLSAPTADNPKAVSLWRLHLGVATEEGVRRIMTHPGYAAFDAVCRRLKSATDAVLPFLLRFDQTQEHVNAVRNSLAKSPPLPTFEDYQQAHGLKSQLVGVANLISNGVLTGEEDDRERRAYWNHVLAGLKPTTNRDHVAKRIDELLCSPRVPQDELNLLNAIRTLEREDALDAEFSLIVSADQSTPRSRYERWRSLRDWGLRHYVRDGVVKFELSEAAFRFYAGRQDPLPRHLRWASEMKAATEMLHGPADDAGFKPDTLQPIHQISLGLAEAIQGHSVALHAAFESVNFIVADLLKRCIPESGEGSSTSAAWQPNAHQLLALGVLKRDGRLRTGVLWERISPKHIEQRAHQNAMRELVDRKRVLTDGKGRATEYWLP